MTAPPGMHTRGRQGPLPENTGAARNTLDQRPWIQANPGSTGPRRCSIYLLTHGLNEQQRSDLQHAFDDIDADGSPLGRINLENESMGVTNG
ncbi:hypothetical protein KQX54_000131 [Cotesia glomerata]|uniref:Uncharacterized protein n=1 Tax=Cotesia glomerata TaxID=32391 RepID=A0AAV7HUE9_COTGL|nr:hypothetical protein KQX54_000131 [Cotesia glomerata]